MKIIFSNKGYIKTLEAYEYKNKDEELKNLILIITYKTRSELIEKIKQEINIRESKLNKIPYKDKIAYKEGIQHYKEVLQEVAKVCVK